MLKTASRTLFWDIADKRKFYAVQQALLKERDSQAADLWKESGFVFAKLLELSPRQEAAWNRMQNLMQRPGTGAGMRNQVFKIADELGLKPPSGVYANSDTPLRKALIKLAFIEPQLRPDLLPLVEAARGKSAVEVSVQEWKDALRDDEAMLRKYEGYMRTLQKGGQIENLTLEGAKSTIQGLKAVIQNKKKLIRNLQKKVAHRDDLKTVIEGKNIRLQTERFTIYMVELPQKPLKRRRVRSMILHINPPGMQPFNAFIVENLLSGRDGAKIGKNDTYDQALKKLQTALGKAEERTIKEWEDKGLDHKPDPWFPRIQQDEINYLLVEPADTKPQKIQGKDFKVESTWVNFSAYDPDADFQSMDPTYTQYEAKSSAAARKFYKMLKAKPDALKQVSWGEFGDWLRKNKIAYKIHHSVYR